MSSESGDVLLELFVSDVGWYIIEVEDPVTIRTILPDAMKIRGVNSVPGKDLLCHLTDTFCSDLVHAKRLKHSLERIVIH